MKKCSARENKNVSNCITNTVLFHGVRTKLDIHVFVTSRK